MTRIHPALRALAGPALIIAAVLAVLHDVGFGGRVTPVHYDPLGYWLPTHCVLGRSLASGEVPTWNPFSMGGMPFAANPQSGWMYLPAMILYGWLPCATAIRVFVVLQPVLAGLGTYAFARSERLSRPAATVGGVVLALTIAGSMLSASLPFSGSLAWIAVLLACASRWLRADRAAPRLVWLLLVALSWGQLASAHPSDGLAIGSVLLVAFTAAKLTAQMRAGTRSARSALAAGAWLVAALPLVNLAILLPRIAYLPRTTLGLGFRGIEDLSARLAGGEIPGFRVGRATEPAWILKLATTPGAYLGGAALLLLPAAWSARSHRPVVVGLGAVAALSYVLSLRIVARAIAPVLRPLPLSDFYLHSPWRLRFAVIAALPILAAIGFEAIREKPGRAIGLFVGAALVWGLLPLLLGVPPGQLATFASGLGVALLALQVIRRYPTFAGVLPFVLAVELSAAALAGQARPEIGAPSALGGGDRLRPLTNLPEPNVDVEAYLRHDSITRSLPDLGRGRYLSLAPDQWTPDRGFRISAAPSTWPLMANNRSALFGVEDVFGYDPVQPLSFWTFVRSVEGGAVNANYRQATFTSVHPLAADLLQITHAVTAAGRPPEADAVEVARAGRWSLFRRAVPVARASFISDWTIAPTLEDARAEVLRPGFDPSRRAVLETQPGVSAGPETAGASVRYAWTNTRSARIDLVAPSGGLVLVRNTWDPGWEATVDGAITPVLRADGLVQAVPVGEGRHTILLSHRDPWITRGVVGSAASVALLLLVAAIAWRRGPPGRREDEAQADGNAHDDGPGPR